MITKQDLHDAQAAADKLFPELRPSAREALDAFQEESRASALQSATPHSGQHASASPAAPASAAVPLSIKVGRSVPAEPLSASQCVCELTKMVEVQHEVLTTLKEFLPHCASASAKARSLVSDLLRVTEEQSSYILEIKTRLAMGELRSLK